MSFADVFVKRLVVIRLLVDRLVNLLKQIYRGHHQLVYYDITRCGIVQLSRGMSIMSSLLPTWCVRLCRVVPDVGEHFFSLGDSSHIIVPLYLVVSPGLLTFVVWLKN